MILSYRGISVSPFRRLVAPSLSFLSYRYHSSYSPKLPVHTRREALQLSSPTKTENTSTRLSAKLEKVDTKPLQTTKRLPFGLSSSWSSFSTEGASKLWAKPSAFPLILAVVALTSAGCSILIYDFFADRHYQNIFYTWDSDWDARWRPTKTSSIKERKDDVDSKMKSEEETKKRKSGGKEEVRSSRQLLLVRHGQYSNVGGDDDETQGLTENGKKQAHKTGQRLQTLLKGKNIQVIRCSSMKRAKETADIISSYFPSAHLEEDPLLMEGTPEFPEPSSPTFQPTEDEVSEDQPRIEAAFQKYFYRPPPLAKDAKENSVKYDIIVCHGNVIRYFFCRALQFPSNAWLRLATYNCGITWIGINQYGRVSAREFGNVGHLPTELITYH